MFGGFVLRTEKKKGLNTKPYFLPAMKRGYLYLLVFLGLFLVACTSTDGETTFSGIWKMIINIASLQVFGLSGGTAIGAFMRVIVGILVFAILHWAAVSFVFTAPNARRTAMVVALVLATMTAIFIPDQIFAAIGGSYALAFSAVLIAIPVIGGLYLVLSDTILPNTRFGNILRVLTLIIILWILIAVKEQAVGLLKEAIACPAWKHILLMC